MNDGAIKYTYISDFYEAKVVQIGLFSERFLKFIPRGIPNYPSHGVDHSKGIIDLLNKFIEAWSINLTEKEAYLLYLGAWVHDIGCITGRERHNEKSVKIIDKIPFFDGLLEKDIIALLKWVVRAHSSSYPIEKVPNDHLGIRLKLVCSIFRIIDACEISSLKCPKEVYGLIKRFLDLENDRFWKAHMNIISVTFRTPKIIIDIDNLDDSEILIEHLKKEIESVREVFDANDIPLPFVEKVALPFNVRNYGRI